MTFRERLPLSSFFNIAKLTVKKWSIKRTTNCTEPKLYVEEPTITLQDWTSAYHWVKSEKQVLSRMNGDKTVYFMPTSEEVNLNEK